ncbi:MAG: hypothetical protein OEY64_07195 [Nitrospinota bacterium]|nr:hypothetical protein [Nitrospinota bacterium]
MKSNIFAVFGSVFAGLFVFIISTYNLQDFNSEDIGLGINTQSKSGYRDSRLISSNVMEDVNEIVDNFRYYKNNNKYHTALLLGASQLHAINALQESDLLAVEVANSRAFENSDSLVYFQLSKPNANFHDVLGMYLAFTLENNEHPDYLVLPFVYDDLRETGMQNDVIKHLPNNIQEILPFESEGTNQIISLANLENNAVSIGTDDPVKDITMSNSPQDAVEKYIIRSLEGFSKSYEKRGNLQSWIEFQMKYYFRKTKIGIKRIYLASTNKHYMPIEHIQDKISHWNIKAFISLLKITNFNGVKVFVYRQPHRPDKPEYFMHNRKEYDRYFAYISELCIENCQVIGDFELLVPSEYYGLNIDGFPDPFHFQGIGHKLLGEKIHTSLKAQIQLSSINRHVVSR